MSNETENMNQSQRIINATFKCISLKGYANVSLRDIADDAGVVLSQLNYYYKNKEGLFTEVIKMLAQQYLKEVEGRLKKSESANEGISSLINYFEEMLSKTPELFKLLFDLTNMALWSIPLKELLHNLFNDITDLIEKHIINKFPDKGRFKNYSSEILSRMVLGSLFGISVQVMLANGEYDTTGSLSAIQVLFK
jgi:AcrR family transcriptional regulator